MKHFSLNIREFDVSQFVTNVNIHGDDSSAALVCDFGLVSSSTDKNLPRLNINQGDEVSILNNKGKEIFFGHIKSKDKSITGNTINIKAIDPLIIPNNSTGSFNFEETDPAKIAKEVFSSVGLSVGKCVSANKLTRTFDAENLYDIVYTAYYMDFEQTKKPYIIKMKDRQVVVEEKGKVVAKYELNAKENLIDVNYSESSENSVGKVKIFDEDGNEKGFVSGDSVSSDVVQIYKQEKDEDAQARAKAMLKGVERMASATTFGVEDLITGNAVLIKESYTGLNGKFFIVGHTHKYENGTYMCDLDLAFENIMEEKKSGSVEEDEELDSSEGGYVYGSSTSDQIWKYFRARGFSDQAIAGIIGNFKHESGLDPSVIQGGGRGPGHGLAQWEGPRLTALKNFARQRGKSWNDLNTQLDFVMKELNANPTWLNNYKKSTDVAAATRNFEAHYERAGIKHMDSRLSKAQSSFSNRPTKKSYSGSSGKAKTIGAIAKKHAGEVYSQARRMNEGVSDCSSFVYKVTMESLGKNWRGTWAPSTYTMAQRTDLWHEIPLSQVKPWDILWRNGHTEFLGDDGRTYGSHQPGVRSGPGSKYNPSGWTKAFRINGK